jgi:hypothetical protein
MSDLIVDYLKQHNQPLTVSNYLGVPDSPAEKAQPDSVRAPSGQFSATERSLHREAPRSYRPCFKFSKS